MKVRLELKSSNGVNMDATVDDDNPCRVEVKEVELVLDDEDDVNDEVLEDCGSDRDSVVFLVEQDDPLSCEVGGSRQKGKLFYIQRT